MGDLYAAVDLGSNSFHMVVARSLGGGALDVADKWKSHVRLASGLKEDGSLASEVRQRALSALIKIRARLDQLQPKQIRITGTSTMRQMRDGEDFLAEIEDILGAPVEILSGEEEARLIYQGASWGLPHRSRLVVDIGGGSTELILGHGPEILFAQSLPLGCVGHTLKYFPHGQITAEGFESATKAAQSMLLPLLDSLADASWQDTLGCSGTIKAIFKLIATQGWDESITPEGLTRLRQACIDAGHIDLLELEGLKANRRPVLPGGLAILLGIFESFWLQHMEISSRALRAGLIFSMQNPPPLDNPQTPT